MSLLIWLAVLSIVWGGVLWLAASLLQRRSGVSGRARQWIWRGAAMLLATPVLAMPIVTGFGLGLAPNPAIEAPVDRPTGPLASAPLSEPAPVAAAPAIAATEASQASQASQTPPISLIEAALILLACGWGMRIALAWRAALRFRRIVSHSQPMKGAAQASLEVWSKRLKLRRRPKLRMVGSGLSPFSFGVLRPVVCLPADIERGLDAQALDLVVAHECLHVARGDGWLRPLERVIADIFWFNPFAWAMRRELDLARELACDEAVVALTSAHRAYARTLRDVAGMAAGLGASAPAASMSLSAGGRALVLRVKRTLDSAQTKPARATMVVAALLAITAAPIAVAQVVLSTPRAIPSPDAVPSPDVSQSLGVVWSGKGGDIRILHCAGSPMSGGCGAVGVFQNGKPILIKDEGFLRSTIRVEWRNENGVDGPDVIVSASRGGSVGDLTLIAATFGATPRATSVAWDHDRGVNARVADGRAAIDYTFSIQQLQREANAATVAVALPMRWTGGGFALDFGSVAGLADKADIAAMQAELRGYRRAGAPLPATAHALTTLILAGQADRARQLLVANWRGPDMARDEFWRTLCGRIAHEPRWGALQLDRLPNAGIVTSAAGTMPRPISTPQSAQSGLTPIKMQQEAPTRRAVPAARPTAELEARLTAAKAALASIKPRYDAGLIDPDTLQDREAAVAMARAALDDANAGSEPGQGIASAETQLRIATVRMQEGKRRYDAGLIDRDELTQRDAALVIAHARLADLQSPATSAPKADAPTSPMRSSTGSNR